MVDVRSPAEFETAHIASSYNAPLGLLDEHAAEFAARLDRPVVLGCLSGMRAAQAHQRLAGVDARNLHVLAGGVSGYAAAGGQVVRGRVRWSLERQVHLVAGSLVLTGVVASLRAPKAGLRAGGVGARLA